MNLQIALLLSGCLLIGLIYFVSRRSDGNQKSENTESYDASGNDYSENSIDLRGKDQELEQAAEIEEYVEPVLDMDYGDENILEYDNEDHQSIANEEAELSIEPLTDSSEIERAESIDFEVSSDSKEEPIEVLSEQVIPGSDLADSQEEEIEIPDIIERADSEDFGRVSNEEKDHFESVDEIQDEDMNKDEDKDENESLINTDLGVIEPETVESIIVEPSWKIEPPSDLLEISDDLNTLDQEEKIIDWESLQSVSKSDEEFESVEFAEVSSFLSDEEDESASNDETEGQKDNERAVNVQPLEELESDFDLHAQDRRVQDRVEPVLDIFIDEENLNSDADADSPSSIQPSLNLNKVSSTKNKIKRNVVEQNGLKQNELEQNELDRNLDVNDSEDWINRDDPYSKSSDEESKQVPIFQYPEIEGFDKIGQIDYWVKISGTRDVGRESVLAQFRESASKVGKPCRIYGVRLPDNSWCDLETEGEETRYLDMVVTVQLVDHHGPITASQLDRFTALVAKLSEGTGRGFSFMTPVENALLQAEAVADFVNYYESVFVINVKPQHGDSLDGGSILRCATQLGLEQSENNFFVRNKTVGKKKICLYSLANMTDTGHFNFDDIRGLKTRGVTFFTKPAVNRSPGAVFAEMVDTAKAFAARIKGEAVSPNHDDLSQDDIDDIRRSIEKVSKEMEELGMAPGSDEAMRVF